MRIFLGQVLPAGAAPQNPENPFQHPPVLDPRTATFAVLARFGKQGRDLLPLRFGQQGWRPCHRPSLGAAGSAYPSFSRTQPPLFQSLVCSYATASTYISDGRDLGSLHSQLRRFLCLWDLVSPSWTNTGPSNPQSQ